MKTVELYRFLQDGNVTTFTSADKAQTHNSETYDPVAIGRSTITQTGELSKDNLDVTMSLNNTSARFWMNGTSERSLGLTVFSKSVLGTNVMWKGRLAGVTPQQADVKFTFESIFTSMRRPGLRARYQRTCRHPLYGNRCGVNKEAYAVALTATAVNGNVITIPDAAAEPEGDFFTGMLEAPDGTTRFIVAHAGALVTLVRPIATLTAAIQGGDTGVLLYPGCDRSRERCATRFDNLDANGSFPFIPHRNPFDGSSIV